MIHKTETKTPTGKITTWLLKGRDTPTFRVSVFMMDKDYSTVQMSPQPVRDLEVSVFDSENREWKVLVPNGIFSYSEIESLMTADTVLSEVKDFVEKFFGIHMDF